MKILVALILGGLIATLVVACVDPSDSEIRAYREFRDRSGRDIVKAYGKLSDPQKGVVFFGAMKMHPPSGEIDSAVSAQSVSFLMNLRGKIQQRNNFVAAYAFNNAILQKVIMKDISAEDVESLKLPELCVATGADAGVCAYQMSLISTRNNPK